MGLFSSGKSVQRSGSGQRWAKPIAKAAAGTVMDVYNANAGNLADLSGQVSDLTGSLVDKYKAGNAGVDAAGSYIADVLSGKYLNGNPYLEGMIGKTLGDVQDRVGAAYGSRGSFGGTAWTSKLAEGLGNAELGLRYGNYSDEMNRMAGAAGMAPSIAQGQYVGVPEILNSAGTAAEIPYTGINAMSGNLANLFSGGKSTQTGPGIGGQLLGSAIQGASMAAAGSDRRLKKNIVEVGKLPNGLAVYDFTYRNDPEQATYRGVMADEVRELVPEAYIDNFNGSGFAGVNYALVGMPLLKLAA